MAKGLEQMTFKEEHISAEEARKVVAKLMKLAKKNEQIEEVEEKAAEIALVKKITELPSANKAVKAALAATTPQQAMKAVSSLLPAGKAAGTTRRPGRKHIYPAPTLGEIAAYRYFGRKKTYSTAGQSAPKKQIEKLNENETTVVQVLGGAKAPLHMLKLAVAFGDPNPTPTDNCKSYVAVKNALRRLVVGGHVEKVGKGTYQIIVVKKEKP